MHITFSYENMQKSSPIYEFRYAIYAIYEPTQYFSPTLCRSVFYPHIHKYCMTLLMNSYECSLPCISGFFLVFFCSWVLSPVLRYAVIYIGVYLCMVYITI